MRLLFIFLFSLNAVAANVYVVSGDMYSESKLNGRRFRMPNPLAELTFLDRFWTAWAGGIGHEVYRNGPGMVVLENGAFEVATFEHVRGSFRKLKDKGHSVIFKSRIEVVGLLRILSDEDTLAVFHVGHSYEKARFPSPETSFLSVYENGRVAPLDAVRIATAQTRLGKEFVPSPKLELFFTNACHGLMCEGPLRQSLHLPDSIQFVSSSGEEAAGNMPILTTFFTKIEPWVEALPAQPSACLEFLWSQI